MDTKRKNLGLADISDVLRRSLSKQSVLISVRFVLAFSADRAYYFGKHEVRLLIVGCHEQPSDGSSEAA
jgi:hypothetical protein